MDGWKQYSTPEGNVYYYNSVTGETSWDKPASLAGDDGGSSEGLLWIPHTLHGFIAGKFLQDMFGGGCAVTTTDGEEMTVDIPRSQLQPVLKSVLDKNVSDLVQMDDINEAMIVHNLRKRFYNDEIYTNIGTILISVNPFKLLPLYTPSVMESYMKKGTRDMPPHTFNIADNAYRAMVEKKQNQSILISGESGAGKTECTKQCLNYFAELAGSVNGVEQYILLANPILEAFGNAKTLRNNNSSRFGKWVEIHFDLKARICGANTINYLLEKSRVVYQIKGERNFHIFYQLTLGATEEQKKNLELGPPQSFNYLNQSGCITADHVNDEEDFGHVLHAMRTLNFTEEEINHVFELVAAVLHLGNIVFIPGTGKDAESSSTVQNKDVVRTVARLLQVQPAQLEKSLCTRIMEIKGCAPTQIPQTPERASDARNALAKGIYNRLFDWLVRRINQSMEPQKGQRTSIIGVLDIFGFEIFDSNSFEQLCINFTNEKLQQHFNQYTFKLEEKLYLSEGVKHEHIVFIDNQPVLDLIEKNNPQGIMIVLDEQLSVPKSSDETFRLQINKLHGNKLHPNFVEMRTSRTDFKIVHYAGEVVYDVTGFLDKNKDTLQKDLLVLVEGSKHPLINTLFPASEGEVKTSKKTISIQFRAQLDNLMNILNSTEPHYIRCIKPNIHKEPNNFHGLMSLQQLRYAGVFEAVRIRQTGYPFRYTHQNFLKRYGFMNREIANKPGPPYAACRELVSSFPGDFSAVQVGKTRVLYRAPEHRRLELLRNVEVEKVTIRVQAKARGMNARQLLAQMLAVKPVLLNAMHQRKLEGLNAALAQCADITFPMKLIADATALRDLVARELACLARIDQLMKEDHDAVYEQLSEAVDEATELSLDTAAVRRAKDVVIKIRNYRECKASLEEGTATNDRAKLEAAIARAHEINFPQGEDAYTAAVAELERIKQEESLLAALAAQMARGYCTQIDQHTWDHSSIDASSLEAAIQDAEGFGCKTPAGLRSIQEAHILLGIRKALLANDFDTVTSYLKQGNALGFNNDETRVATNEISHNVAVNDLLINILEATEKHDQETLEYTLQQATSLEILDKIEVIKGQELLAQILATRQMLRDAIAAVNAVMLEDALAEAASFNYEQNEVYPAQELLENVKRIQRDAAAGLHYMDKELMEKAYHDADAIGLVTEDIEDIKDALSLDQQKFIQRQLKTANALGDRARAVRLTIQLKDLFFGQFGKMFVFEEFGGLRTPDDFSSTKLFGRDKLREGMLKWSKSPIPTSLTVLDEPFRKMAKTCFKNILGYMGDRNFPYPITLAQELIDTGFSTPSLRNEIYCQVMKQLRENPSQESVARGWNLMKFCLQSFAPTDEFINYLEMFLQNKSKPEKKYVEMLHDTQYGDKKNQAPRADVMEKINDYKVQIDLTAVTQIDFTKSPAPRLFRRGQEPYVPKNAVSTTQPVASARTPHTPASKPGTARSGAPVGGVATAFGGGGGVGGGAAATAGPAVGANKPQGVKVFPGHPSGGASEVVPRLNLAATQQPKPAPREEEQPLSPVEAPPPLPEEQPQYVRKMEILYDYSGDGDPNRLVLYVGGIINVIQDYEGWAFGELDGSQGLFPLNYARDL